MKRSLDGFVFSASDLNHYLACEHLVALERACASGELAPPAGEPNGLVQQKGDEHEAAYLARLTAEGRSIVRLTPRWDDREATEAATLAAMRAGPDVIYQAGFWHDGWRGAADFLIRVDRPSDLGDWSYEAVDTKLARQPKPYFLLQLCFYSEHLARLQGASPHEMHIVLGSNEWRSFRVEDFAPYYRRVKARFVAATATAAPAPEPVPNAHCGLCRWAARCESHWAAIDHLSLVANIRRGQVAALVEAGIPTLAALAEAGPQARPPGMASGTFATLQGQAALQLHHRRTGEHKYVLLPPEPARGLLLLPRPDAGDVFFDMEGDPFVDGGLEYLFGIHYREADDWRFTPFWAHSRDEERVAFEALVDFIADRRRRHPGLHVYHYAAYEESALKRLAMIHGTREEVVDDFLRDGVLVDLYRVVRQGLRASTPSYSIKKMEAFYMDAREADVKTAAGSIEVYERWLETREPSLLADIALYNEEDCVSTRLLRDWLLERRKELEAQHGAQPWPAGAAAEPDEQAAAPHEALDDMVAALAAGAPADPALGTAAERARVTLAHLLAYHRREAKPVWWAYFARCEMSDEELLEDSEALGGLTVVGDGPVRLDKRSSVWRLAFPPQEHKVRVGTELRDPATGRSPGTLVALDEEEGWLELKRGPSFASVPLPRAVFPHTLLPTTEQQQALQRLARAVIDGGAAGPARFRALWDLLVGAPPRFVGRPAGTPLQTGSPTVQEVVALAATLDESTLVVQGPPGAGKTYMGARVVVALMRAGKRVGIAATSHKAIHNLLAEIEAVAAETGYRFRGMKKASAASAESTYHSAHGMIESLDSNAVAVADYDLVAGTAWFFAPESRDGACDYLVLDEAGQIALADALAMGTAARNLILLGDPQQLPHVTQGVHPAGSGRSVLEYVLAGKDTIPPERGIFLDRTWRMHPTITAYVSALAYEGRLASAARCGAQRVEVAGLLEAGLHFLPVAHAGNSVESPEEAEAIAALFARLVGAPYETADGARRALTAADILVVSPYNRQVERLRASLPPGARVGTVDKFQGQEAAAVVFSMAASDGEEIPRNLEFLFDRNRLNVAISRAKCLAFLVASPALLDVVCGSVEQMRLVSAICAFVERAAGVRQLGAVAAIGAEPVRAPVD